MLRSSKLESVPETKQHLLRPLTTYERDRSYWLTLCAQSAAATSEAQRRLHQGKPFSPTITALHSVFLSGITLLHCVRTLPSALTPADTHKAIRATSSESYYARFGHCLMLCRHPLLVCARILTGRSDFLRHL